MLPDAIDDTCVGVVRWFDDTDAHGAITAAEVPGGCYVHIAHVHVTGCPTLHTGHHVWLRFVEPGFLQTAIGTGP